MHEWLVQGADEGAAATADGLPAAAEGLPAAELGEPAEPAGGGGPLEDELEPAQPARAAIAARTSGAVNLDFMADPSPRGRGAALRCGDAARGWAVHGAGEAEAKT
jgi:hypothetical protein